MKKTLHCFSFILIILITLTNSKLFAQSLNTSPHVHNEYSKDISDLLHYYDQKIYFTENRGQWPVNMLYKADFAMGQAVATSSGMMVGVYNPKDLELQHEQGLREEYALKNNIPFNEERIVPGGHVWQMNFLNHSKSMRVQALGAHSDPINYFTGDLSLSNVSSYNEVWYRNVYNKVDVRYYPSETGTLEYDVVCYAGFDKKEIAIQYEGIENMSVNAKGELVLKTNIGPVTFPAPIAYQVVNGKKQTVKVRYVVNRNVVSFDLGKYDVSKDLIIDPIALRWATWVNSNSTGDNHGHCIWVDPSDGAIYVVARVVGTTNFMSTTGVVQPSAAGNLETIVGKYLEPSSIGGSGTRVWQTYIGGANDDNPYAMEQGPDGALYITGYTSSANFPLIGGTAFGVTGGIDHRSQAGNNIFIMKISTDGQSMKACVLGGNASDDPYDIRLSNNGDVLVCGSSTSTNLNTQYGSAGAVANAGGRDAFVLKVNQALTSVLLFKNYGGSGADQANIMLVNPVTQEIYVAGYTESSNFPTIIPRENSLGGTRSGFIQKLKPNGAFIWSSYFRSANSASTSPLCMEFSFLRDKLYFGGLTTGLGSGNISTSGVHKSTVAGTDFFVCLMDTDQTFQKATYLGGSGNEGNMMGLNVDLNNDVFIFGYTPSTNYPTAGNPLQSTNQGSSDKVFTKLKSDLSAVEYSTYYGGTSNDYDPVGQRGIKFSNCRIYTIVTAQSNNIPLTAGAISLTKSSPTTRYEPGLVVWANPPDLVNNEIFGNQIICAGQTPGNLTGSTPSYQLPTISRNNVNSAYPSFPSTITYTWQYSTDSINWTNIGGNTKDLPGSTIGALNQKTYFRRIINGDACVIAGAANQTITIKTMSVTATINNVTCNGFNNGSLVAIPVGTPPFNYTWFNGNTTNTVSGLAPGAYGITVTDAAGCSTTNTFSITQPSVLNASISSTDATCGAANGTATVIASGGTVPYTYLWSNGSTVSNPVGLLAGPYSVTVKDANQCTIVKSVTVNQASTLSVVVNKTDVTCNGALNGTATANPSGGTSPYTYLWSTGSTNNSINGLSGNIYSVTVKDANNCTVSGSANVAEPALLSATAQLTQVSCFGGANGSINLTPSGGNGGNTYIWSNGATTEDISGLAASTYFVTIKDSKNCTYTNSYVISQPNKIETTTSTVYACDNYLLPWGQSVSISNVYTNIYTAANGCDSTVNIPVIIKKSSSGSSNHVACNQLTIGGVTYTASGSHSVTYTNAAGCDSVHTYYVTINYSNSGSSNHVACNQLNIGGVTYTASGSHSVTYTNAAGCDSVHTYYVTINYSNSGSSNHVACNQLNIGGVTYTASGSHSVTYTNAAGCDSVHTYYVTINYSNSGSSQHVACNQLSIGGVTYTASGSHSVTYTNAAGCDSVHTYYVTINYSNSGSSNHVACNQLTIGGVTYTASGSHSVTYTNAAGCDSVHTYYVTINYSNSGSSQHVACNQLTIGGVTYTASGSHSVTYTNATGCDSVHTYYVTINNYSVGSSNHVACNQLTIGGVTYTASGSHSVTYTNAAGCDSVHTYYVTINNYSVGSSNHVACNQLNIGGVTYTASGSHSVTYTNAAGCDSVHTYYVTINYSNSGSSNHVACNQLNIGGVTYTASGSHSVTYTNAAGCDSVHTYYVTINYSNSGSSQHVACNQLTIGGVTYTASGSHSVTYTNAAGCDSVHTYYVTINYSNSGSSNHVACNQLTIGGVTYTASGSHSVTYTNAAGCDSVHTYYVTINYSNSGSSQHVACNQLTIGGVTYTASGSHSVTYTNAAGCDSVHTYYVTINNYSVGSSNHVACNQLTIGGVTYTASGSHSVTYTNAAGCDSVHTYYVTINYSNSGSSNHVACNQLTIGGVTYTASGSHSVTYTNAAGCDSVHTYYVTINYSNSGSSNHVACNQLNIGGVTYTASGSHSVTYTNAAGCDSVHTYYVTINYSNSGSSNHVACNQLNIGGVTYTASGSHSVTYTNAAGCDSVHTYYVTINYSNSGSSNHVACNQLNIGGVTYTASGSHSVTYTNAAGCDSVHTYYVTINYSNSGSSNHVACNQLTIGGVTYTASGSHSVTYTNAAGCDSVHTYYVTINYSNSGSSNHVACNQLNIGGVTYTASGSHSVTYTNAAGCDSVHTYYVTINYSNSGSSNHVACNQLTIGGVTYTASGSHSVTYTNAAGCDSVHTYYVTINNYSVGSSNHVACNQLNIGGVTYTASGSHSVTYTNAAGCDSVHTYYVTINYSNSGSSNHVACNQLNIGGVTYTASGSHSVTYTNAAGCDSVHTYYVTINYSNSGSSNHVACNQLTIGGVTYTASGSHSVTYTNAAGCDSVHTYYVTINYSNSGSSNHVACNQLNIGGVTYTASGSHSVTYTNAAGCDSVHTYYVTINYSNSGSSNHVACNQLNIGGVTYTASGSHSVTYTNAAGCDSVHTYYVTINYSNSGSSNHVACNQLNIGGVTYTASGSHSVTYTNAAGCDSVHTYYVTINNYSVGSSNHVACNQLNIGGVTYTASGSHSVTYTNAAGCDSVHTYYVTINYSNSGSSQHVACNQLTIGGVTYTASGSHSVTYTNAAGCDSVHTYYVIINYKPQVQITGNNIFCNGGSTVICATPGLNYSWSNGSTEQCISVQVTDIYSVTVTDINSCSNEASISVTELSPVTATVVKTNPTLCQGNQCNGIAIITPQGGSGNYTAAWSQSGVSGFNPTNLCPGIYFVTVHDQNQCSTVVDFGLVCDAPCISSVNLTSDYILCYGSTTTAYVTINSGTAPYTIQWSNGVTATSNTNTASISGVGAGLFSVTVTDVNGCSASGSKNITQPNFLAFNYTKQNTTCGACNGSVTVNPYGGTSPYTVVWSGGVTGNTRNNLCAGIYFFSVYDKFNCCSTGSVQINASNGPSVALQANPILCNGGTTQVTATITGGNAPYSVVWSNGTSTSTNSNIATASNIAAGNFSVTVTSANGCSTVKSIYISQPELLTASVIKSNPTSCQGNNCNGSATITVSGGTGNYTAVWSQAGISGLNPTNLCPGIYYVTVYDANQCSAVVDFGLTCDAPCISSVTLSNNNILCNGGTTSVTVNINSGTAPYTVNWSNGNSAVVYTNTASINNISAGDISVTVTDVNGCSASASKFISQPNAVEFTVVKNDANCASSCSGTVMVTPSGGTAPYTVIWADGVTAGSRVQLCSGVYYFTVYDKFNCQKSGSVDISSSPGITATITNGTIKCNGESTFAKVTISGAGAPYLVSWSNGVTASINTTSHTNATVFAGTISVTVTNSSGCTASASKVISQPTPLNFTTTQSNITCFSNCNGTGSATVTPSGGTSPYSIIWNNGATTFTRTGLAAGTYSFTVKDKFCSKTGSITITAPIPIVINGNVTHVKCNGSSTGSIILSVSGGLPQFTYSWKKSGSSTIIATTKDISNLSAGTYSVTVKDANNCTASKSFTITQPSAISICITKTNPTSNTASNGKIKAVVSGGTSPYQYFWSGPNNYSSSGSNIISFLKVGTYKLTVVDANGCSKVETIVLSAGVCRVEEQSDEVIVRNMNVYPNPASSILNVSLEGFSGNTVVRIYNYIGQEVLNQSLMIESNTNVQFDINHLAAGAYMIVAEDAAGRRTTKVIKQ